MDRRVVSSTFGLLAAASLLGCGLVACAPPNKAVPYPKAPAPAGADAPPQDASPPQPEDDVRGIAHFFDREIDLAPFLTGFPYGNFSPSLETGKLFLYHLGDAYTLQVLDLPAPGKRYDLESAKTISDVDWSKRSLWSMQHHAASNKLWLHADESNDEVMNLWTLEIETGKLQQITKHDYVYGFGFNEDETQIGYLPRKGKKAPFETCLHVLDVASGTDRKIICDDPSLTFTWSEPQFSPDGRELYFNAQIEGDRTRVQVVRVDLGVARPKAVPITNKKVERNSPEILEGWLGDELLFIANDDGYGNLYAYHRKTSKVRQITRFTEDLTSAELTANVVVAVHRTPAGSTVVVVDPRAKKVLSQRKLPGTADVHDAHEGRVYLSQSAPDTVYEGLELPSVGLPSTGGKPSLGVLTRVVTLDPKLERKIVQCQAQAVQIPTFDTDKKTGKRRTLHAFLLEPRRPPEQSQQDLAIITAFYGGHNGYSRFDQIMCAAGVTVVSPAVRGSTGFGRVFYSLNDKDLGGNEIVDLFWVGKWLEQRTGLPSRRIGVYGGSHGGYATMRALTFPPGTNGHEEVYPFGFGMAHAGFSDIKSFYDATNIPDWVVLESGDPSVPEELERMKDRSPLTHAGRLQAPLLLTHGSKDWRVPVTESRRFADAARKLKRPINYIEVEGQGHHIEGLGLQVQVFQARFDFLMAVAKAAPAAEAVEGASGEAEAAKEP